MTARATVFTIAGNRSAPVAQGLLGDKEDQVVTSDRFKADDWLWAYLRQICWSHLRRDFQAMIDRGGPGQEVGRRLRLSDRLFALWHPLRGGTLDEPVCREQTLRLIPRVRRALADGWRCACTRTAGTCTEILQVEEGLWNFVWFPGVEPTNNAGKHQGIPSLLPVTELVIKVA